MPRDFLRTCPLPEFNLAFLSRSGHHCFCSNRGGSRRIKVNLQVLARMGGHVPLPHFACLDLCIEKLPRPNSKLGISKYRPLLFFIIKMN